MSEAVTPRRFHEVDWRVVRNDASTPFRTGSFAEGLALVDAIGGVADAANHHPDVDLRSDGVTVRLRSNSHGRLSERDVALARQISEAARELDVPIDLTGLQSIQVAIDAMASPTCCVLARCLGYEEVDDADLIDPLPGAAVLVPADGRAAPPAQPDPYRCVSAVDQAEARIAAALAAGGHLVSDENAPEWWTLADAEGNEVDVAPWPDRDRPRLMSKVIRAAGGAGRWRSTDAESAGVEVGRSRSDSEQPFGSFV